MEGDDIEWRLQDRYNYINRTLEVDKMTCPVVLQCKGLPPSERKIHY